MPRDNFVHDCDGCVYLGRSEDDRHDLYHCPRCDGGSLVARYGSDGPAYASAPIEIVERVTIEGWTGLDGLRFPGSSPEVRAYPLAQALRLLRRGNS